MSWGHLLTLRLHHSLNQLWKTILHFSWEGGRRGLQLRDSLLEPEEEELWLRLRLSLELVQEPLDEDEEEEELLLALLLLSVQELECLLSSQLLETPEM